MVQSVIDSETILGACPEHGRRVGAHYDLNTATSEVTKYYTSAPFSAGLAGAAGSRGCSAPPCSRNLFDRASQTDKCNQQNLTNVILSRSEHNKGAERTAEIWRPAANPEFRLGYNSNRQQETAMTPTFTPNSHTQLPGLPTGIK